MSEIKPVVIIKTAEQRIDAFGNFAVTNGEHVTVYTDRNKAMLLATKEEAAELRAAYEVLQARIKELEISAKYAEHIDATPANQRETMMYDTLVERDALKAENEALRKKVEELLVTTGMQYLDIANLKSALSAYGDPDVLANDED